MDDHLSPAETARRFGISIKALRLYERQGLLQPLRTSNGSTGAPWRVYGSPQLARLHQILALKRLGLSLGQIGELLIGGDALDPVLAFQERVLVKDGERVARALAITRKARAKLASGASLSIDDLAALSQETVMTKPITPEEMNEAISPFKEKHLSPEQSASLREWGDSNRDLVDKGKALVAEAGVLMTSGDAESPEAMDFARRFLAVTRRIASLASPVLAVRPQIEAALADARADPQTSPKIEVLTFIQKVMARYKAHEAEPNG